MKIALWYNLPSGGAKRALYYQVRGLVERGHTIEAWRPPSVDLSYLPLGGLIVEHVVPMDWRPNYHRSAVTRLLHPRPDILRGHAALDRHARACAEQINAGDFDLFFSHPCQYLVAPPVARYVQLPSALYLQEPRRVNYEASPELPWLALPEGIPGWWTPRGVRVRLADSARMSRVRADARLELENARAFDAILVNSLFSRESVLRAYGRDAHVCYLGVDTALFAPKELPREDVVVGVGMVVPAKNLDLIVEALARVRTPRPRLIWVGNISDGAYVEHITRLARERDVALQIKVRVSDDELVGLLNTARLMAYAPRLEPFGYAPLEANACALPVVTVAEGGLRETIVDGVTGLVVEHDPQAMGGAITRLLDDPAYAATLGENGRRIVCERWSLERSTEQLERHLAPLHRVEAHSPAHIPRKLA